MSWPIGPQLSALNKQPSDDRGNENRIPDRSAGVVPEAWEAALIGAKRTKERQRDEPRHHDEQRNAANLEQRRRSRSSRLPSRSRGHVGNSNLTRFVPSRFQRWGLGARAEAVLSSRMRRERPGFLR